MRNRVIFLILVAILAIAGCERKPADTKSGDIKAASVAPRTNPGSVLNVPPERMKDALADIYRLKPDGRFLTAVAEVHAFLTGEEPAAVSADFEDGRWRISYRGKAVGSLPELPDFPDFMNMLKGWVQTLQKEHPVHWGERTENVDYREIDGLLDGFLSFRVLTALHKIDDRWKETGSQPELLAAATRGLTLLLVQSLDGLETGDHLPTKAVAVLALTKALTGNDCVRDECLLSSTMDYSRHAVELSEKLPESDPVRWYVLQDSRRLAEIAIQENAPYESRYLSLLRMVQNVEDVDSIVNWLKVYFADASLSLPVMKAWMDMKGFSTVPHLSEALPRLVMLDIFMDIFREKDVFPAIAKSLRNQEKEDYNGAMLAAVKLIDEAIVMDTPTMFDHFQSGLEKASSNCKGPFLDPKSYQAFYNGYFFSCFYAAGLHYLDALSSSSAAEEFLSALPESSGIGGELRHCFRDLTASKEGKTNPGVLQADLENLRQLGMPPIMRIFFEQGKYLGFGDPDRLKAVKGLMPHLDTRISHRQYLYSAAVTHLMDLKMSGNLAESIIAAAPLKDARFQARYAELKGDVKFLQELLYSDGLKRSAKIYILECLAKQPGVSQDILREQYRNMLNDYRDNWDFVNAYAAYLEQTGQYEDERIVLKGWLDRDVTTLGLEPIFAWTAIARAYYKEGRYEEGLKIIAPIIGSQQAGAMQRGAELLEKLNRKAESEKLAEAIVDRYPDGTKYRTLLARLYWSHGKPKEAASVLKAGGKLLTMDLWQFTIAPEFAEVFSDRPKDEGLAAFSALMAEGFGHFELVRLTFPLAKKGKNELAFAMSSQLQWNGIGNLELLLHSYGYLKEYMGKPHAVAWLRSKIPPPMLNPLSMIAYREKQYELMWDLIPDPGTGKDADFVWLMRAAASLRLGPGNDPHRNDLLAHYPVKSEGVLDAISDKFSGITSYFGGGKDTGKSNGYDGYYDKVGRFLCGLMTEEEVLKLATEPNRRCEIAYYIGLRAQCEGRYADASDWYRVAVETGLIKMGEYRWAYDTLYKWYTEDKSLSRLESEGL